MKTASSHDIDFINAAAEIEIPFHDVDMMEIAWHGHYVKYFEIARCCLLDKINYNYQAMQNSGFGWPIIEMHIRYAKPLKYQQKIKIIASLVEWETRMKIDYKIIDFHSPKAADTGAHCASTR